MQDLGRTLTTYMNNRDRRKRFSEEEMILHMLDLNGVRNIEELEMYIKDDIERYGTKLEDCHRRLKRFLTELLVCCIPVSANVFSARHYKKAMMGQICLRSRMRVSSAATFTMNWVKITLDSEN
jgi:hypothetical protein